MIKYFYYEVQYINNDYIIKNEMVLDKKPMTDQYGYRTIYMNNTYGYYIDVDKMIRYYDKLLNTPQKVYDKLLPQVIRNKKLETL